jgi:hypothetical protein
MVFRVKAVLVETVLPHQSQALVLLGAVAVAVAWDLLVAVQEQAAQVAAVLEVNYKTAAAALSIRVVAVEVLERKILIQAAQAAPVLSYSNTPTSTRQHFPLA